MHDDDDLDDSDSRDENPQASDMDDSDEPEMVTCPNCRKWIVEESERCPKCGHYVSAEEPERVPMWIWITVVLLLVVPLLYYVMGRLL